MARSANSLQCSTIPAFEGITDMAAAAPICRCEGAGFILAGTRSPFMYSDCAALQARVVLPDRRFAGLPQAKVAGPV